MSTRSAKLQVLNSSQLRTTFNELPLEVRRPTVEVLNGVLAEMIDLSLAARHAHWNVRGRNFASLHIMFGCVHRQVDKHIDEIGERISALGGMARGTVQFVTVETALDAFPTLASGEKELAEALAQRLGQLGSAVHNGIAVCGPLHDPVSVHVLTSAAATVDKLLWKTECHVLPSH